MCILPNNKYNKVYKPVVAQWIDALLANTEHQGSIPAAAMFGDKLATCPCKNTQQLKRRLDAFCASNGSGRSLSFFLSYTYTIGKFCNFRPFHKGSRGNLLPQMYICWVFQLCWTERLSQILIRQNWEKKGGGRGLVALLHFWSPKKEL
jgi:hypothetical protein